MSTMTAEPLIDRLARDLDRAFPDVVRQVSGDLYSGALRMLGNRQDAEDVTQEALVRAYRALGGYPADRIRRLRLRPWLWTIAANLCRNRLRSRSRRGTTALDADPADPAPGPEAHAEHTGMSDELASLLGDLPWAMRAAVVLHHVVGMPYDEISVALERPAATVRSDVHRGLARLREAYPHEEEP
jgi:RNA polymerase sigma factor (sigma-70 family)